MAANTTTQTNITGIHFLLKTLAVFCVIIIAGFGIMAIQYGFSIRNGTEQWVNQLLYWMIQTNTTPEPGLSTVEDALGFYQAELGAMMTHMIIGGLVVSLGMLQFIPSLRRKYPYLHRLLGMLMMSGMLAVSVSAIVFLNSITKEQEIAGKSFYIGLWGLAVLSLILLTQSVLALLSKDFRGHMLWMGMAFACFLTAPFLRVNYTMVGSFETMTLNRLVQNSVGSSLAITLSLVMLWLIHTGDRDLPYRGEKSALQMPKSVVGMFAAFSAIAYAAAAWLASIGQVEHLSLRTENLWIILALWALAKIWITQQSVSCWQKGMQGGKPSVQYSIALLIGVLLTLSLLPFIDRSSFQGHAFYYSLIHFSAVELILLALALCTPAISTGRSLFTLASAATTWSASLMPLMMLGAVRQGLMIDEAFYSALGRVVSITILFSIGAAAIARPRLLPQWKQSGRKASSIKQAIH